MTDTIAARPAGQALDASAPAERGPGLFFGIRPKLFAGFGALLLLMVLLGAAGLLNLGDVAGAGNLQYENTFAAVRDLGRMQLALADLQSHLVQALVDPAPQARESHRAAVQQDAAE